MDLKVRVWDKVNEMMLCNNADIDLKIGSNGNIKSELWQKGSYVCDDVIMFGTAIKDRNDKEINVFEGDILEFEEWDFFGHDSWLEKKPLTLDIDGFKVGSKNLSKLDKVILIGNIYEDKHLIAKSK